MSFWRRIFFGNRSKPKPPPDDRAKISRPADEGEKLFAFPEQDRCCLWLLFDYDQLEGDYGRKIFQTLWRVLGPKGGLCVFADGDLLFTGGKDMEQDVTIVPTYSNGPLARFASFEIKSIHPYTIAVYQEDYYTREVHYELMREFDTAYLGCMLKVQLVYSLREFEQLAKHWRLVRSMEFHMGQIVQNAHGISA